MTKILVAIPTYNERENAPRLWSEINKLGPDWDVMFVDDNSPDGTGAALEEIAKHQPRLNVMHRSGKLGVGSAHVDAILHAYKQGYDILVTMDCDFTHSPADIQRFLDASAGGASLVTGSRYMMKESLQDWNLLRRFITKFAHGLTWILLGIPFDASGGFRCYDLKRLPQNLFRAIQSKSYSFFFESIFLIHQSGFRITEVPINLPSRTYGTSKLNGREAFRSGMFLLRLWMERLLNPGRFRFGRQAELSGQSYEDGESWREYWSRKADFSGLLYESIAAIYRTLFIQPNLERALKKAFPPGSQLLHAGCGSGQVDTRLHDRYKINALDVSDVALSVYAGNNPAAHRILQGTIFGLPFADESLDGVYNMGVVEHFTHEDIVKILREFRRVLKPGGKCVIFWPHRRAPSVRVIKAMEAVTRIFGRRDRKFHPPEISLIKGRDEARQLVESGGLHMTGYSYSARDLWIQAVVEASK